MIYENKKIPETWTRKSSYLKILKKIFTDNEEMKQIALTNHKNNEQRKIYNQKLKENLPLLKNKYTTGNAFEYDNDLMTLVNNRKKLNNKIKIPKIRSLNEEYKEMMKNQIVKSVISKPDSIKQNLNNILNYRKKIALRFKYNHIKFRGKSCAHLNKSKSQILNSIHNNKLLVMNKNKDMVDIDYKNNNKKEYEDKLLVTGMNNRKYKIVNKNEVIDENNEIIINNKHNYRYNIKNQ